MQLYKPKRKGDVISRVKPMPEGADQKHVKLLKCPTLDGRAIVDALPEPILDSHVPVIEFIPRMDGSFEDPRVDRVDSVEGGAIEADT